MAHRPDVLKLFFIWRWSLKLWTNRLWVLVGWMLMTAPGLAGDVEDLIASEQAHFAVRNAEDVEAWVQYHWPGRTGFGPGGVLLSRADSLEDDRQLLRGQLADGMKFNHQLRHVEVQIYGDAAVTTSYIVGTTTYPDGSTYPLTMRRTGLLIKRDSQWKEVHNHASPLVAALP